MRHILQAAVSCCALSILLMRGMHFLHPACAATTTTSTTIAAASAATAATAAQPSGHAQSSVAPWQAERHRFRIGSACEAV